MISEKHDILPVKSRTPQERESPIPPAERCTLQELPLRSGYVLLFHDGNGCFIPLGYLRYILPGLTFLPLENRQSIDNTRFS